MRVDTDLTFVLGSATICSQRKGLQIKKGTCAKDQSDVLRQPANCGGDPSQLDFQIH